MRSENRLRRSVDFKQVRAQRRSWAHPLLVCLVRDRGGREPPRVGIVVGRPAGKAVTRNRVKRRIREVLRPLAGQMLPGYDMVIVARAPSGDASFQELSAALHSLVRRAQLLREQPREVLNQVGGS